MVESIVAGMVVGMLIMIWWELTQINHKLK